MSLQDLMFLNKDQCDCGLRRHLTRNSGALVSVVFSEGDEGKAEDADLQQDDRSHNSTKGQRQGAGQRQMVRSRGVWGL